MYVDEDKCYHLYRFKYQNDEKNHVPDSDFSPLTYFLRCRSFPPTTCSLIMSNKTERNKKTYEVEDIHIS